VSYVECDILATGCAEEVQRRWNSGAYSDWPCCSWAGHWAR